MSSWGQPPSSPPPGDPWGRAWGPSSPQPYPGWPPAPSAPYDGTQGQALRTARTALGWAIGAAVGAGLALIGLVIAFVVGLAGAGDGYFYETLRGEVVGLPEGAALSGDRLERPLVDLLREYGTGDVDISCPDTAAVSVSTVVVCSGVVDGFEWTGIVVFEDSEGSFAVAEL